MKWIVAGLFLALGLVGFLLAGCLESPRATNIAGNLGASFMEICLAIVVVSIFLDGRDKQRAIGALSALTSTPMRRFLEKVEHDAIDAFGRTGFVNILDEFSHEADSRSALSLDSCARVASIYLSDRAVYDKVLDRVSTSVKELRVILGWSFDSEVLESISKTGEAIDLLKEIGAVDSDDAKRDICKYFLDVFLTVQDLSARLGAST